jgi:hypothetical protein
MKGSVFRAEELYLRKILFLVLRNTITLLRRFGLASVLPLDHHIYLHKVSFHNHNLVFK